VLLQQLVSTSRPRCVQQNTKIPTARNTDNRPMVIWKLPLLGVGVGLGGHGGVGRAVVVVLLVLVVIGPHDLSIVRC
jgi:hypothetical protein